MGEIIVSYLKSDPLIGQLGDFLVERFGAEFVRVGISEVVRGQANYVVQIERSIREADGLIVVIDAGWGGHEWVPYHEDYEYIAITTALRAGVNISVVLLPGIEGIEPLPKGMEALREYAVFRLTEGLFREDAAEIANAIAAGINLRRMRRSAPPVSEPQIASAPEEVGQLPEADRAPLFINALMYPFVTDPKWLSKIGLGAILSIIPLVGSFIVVGYGARAAQRLLDEQAGLPEWDQIWNDFVRGTLIVIGGIFLGLLVFLPVTLVMDLMLGVGASRVYDEALGEFVMQPNSASALLALATFFGGLYFYTLMYMTAVLNYIQGGRWAAFGEFKTLLAAASTHFSLTGVYMGNLAMFTLVTLIAIVVGFNLLVLPGYFIGAASTIGYYYFLYDWSKRLKRAAARRNQTIGF